MRHLSTHPEVAAKADNETSSARRRRALSDHGQITAGYGVHLNASLNLQHLLYCATRSRKGTGV